MWIFSLYSFKSFWSTLYSHCNINIIIKLQVTSSFTWTLKNFLKVSPPRYIFSRYFSSVGFTRTVRPCVTLLSARAIFAKVRFYTPHLDEVVRPVRKEPKGKRKPRFPPRVPAPAPLSEHDAYMYVVYVCVCICMGIVRTCASSRISTLSVGHTDALRVMVAHGIIAFMLESGCGSGEQAHPVARHLDLDLDSAQGPRNADDCIPPFRISSELSCDFLPALRLLVASKLYLFIYFFMTQISLFLKISFKLYQTRISLAILLYFAPIN